VTSDQAVTAEILIVQLLILARKAGMNGPTQTSLSRTMKVKAKEVIAVPVLGNNPTIYSENF